MPNFDGTGPRGQGPKTGRGMGKCDDSKPAGQFPAGRGKGRGQGGGRVQSRGNGQGRGR